LSGGVSGIRAGFGGVWNVAFNWGRFARRVGGRFGSGRFGGGRFGGGRFGGGRLGGGRFGGGRFGVWNSRPGHVIRVQAFFQVGTGIVCARDCDFPVAIVVASDSIIEDACHGGSKVGAKQDYLVAVLRFSAVFIVHDFSLVYGLTVYGTSGRPA
jgi:hypothetical protein